jgi:hypothetical protein
VTCAWCSARVTMSAFHVQACGDHEADWKALVDEVWRIRARGSPPETFDELQHALRVAKCERDDAELRGDPPDMSGWVLWGRP